MRWALTGIGIALALVSASCTIERVFPLEAFACGNGGPCDAGTTVGLDAEADPTDATPGKDVVPGQDVIPGTDAETPDAGGPILAACPKILPLPSSGLISGSTEEEVNTYEPNCSAPGGPDSVYGFNVPGDLRELIISTDGSDFDTSLHLYRDDCTPLNRITCNDEHESAQQPLQSTSFIELTNVPAGSYAVVVDGFGSDESGTYVLKVTGKLAPGQPCDPMLTYLTCEIGTCTPTAGVFSCPAVLDCPDGIDADDDGMIDEDVCDTPPTVNCTPTDDPFTNDYVDLIATVFDQGGLTFREWKVVQRPFGSFDRPFDPGQEATFFYPDLAGAFRIRYRAADDLFQLSACEVTFSMELIEQMRVELIWNGELRQHEHDALVNLHVLHPTATRWFDSMLDCASPFCLNTPHEWGAQGEDDDPFLVGLRLGPQWVSVPLPQYSGTYGIGVEYEFDNFRQSTSAVVNIFCNGVLQQTLGPVLLQNGQGLPEDNDFWKVAEIDMAAGGCQVIPYMSGGMPVVVTGQDAESAR